MSTEESSKTTKGLENKTDEERLEELQFFSPEKRSQREDSVTVFKHRVVMKKTVTSCSLPAEDRTKSGGRTL